MMVKMSKLMMRIALLFMLFQFFAPSVFSVVTQGPPNTRETNYHTRHNSIVAPLFIKEKDENELEENSYTRNQTPILDFAIHSLNLKATHSCVSNYVPSDVLYDSHPALFASYCTFLI